MGVSLVVNRSKNVIFAKSTYQLKIEEKERMQKEKEEKEARLKEEKIARGESTQIKYVDKNGAKRAERLERKKKLMESYRSTNV